MMLMNAEDKDDDDEDDDDDDEGCWEVKMCEA